MKLWRSLVIAFGMYSAIPMPRVDWDGEGMKYVFCFFPLVGLPVAGALWLWALFCRALGLGEALLAAGLTLLPLAVTGGIHMDGFCDTADALGSRRSREEQLRILSDPHSGAFAVMGAAGHLLLTWALWLELIPDLSPGLFGALGLGFVLSRSLSGFAVATFRLAKGSGLVHAFAEAAQRRTAAGVSAAFALLSAGGMVLLARGPGLGAAAGAALAFFGYRRMAYRRFGGITGDLAGFFLEVCEVMILAGAAVGLRLG